MGDLVIKETATYMTHNKHDRRITTPSEEFEPVISEIAELQSMP